MQQWSCYYHLPVGLHCDWPLFSSVAYGARPPTDASLPPHSRREEVYANYKCLDDRFVNRSSYPEPETAIPASSSIAVSPASHSPSSPDDNNRTVSNQIPIESSFTEPDAAHGTPLALKLAPSASASQSSPTAGPIIHPDDDAADRPTKRLAGALGLSPERAVFLRLRTDAARASTRRILPTSLPRRPFHSRETASETVSLPASITHERNPDTSDVLGMLEASFALPVMCKRKHDDEATIEEIARITDWAAAQAVNDSTLSGSPHAPMKRRRTTHPTAPIRRSLRVREKATAMVHGS